MNSKPTQLPNLTLEVLPEQLAVARLDPSEPIPAWALRSQFFSVSKTSDELSVLCLQADIPSDVIVEANWRAFKVKGPLDFSLTGILAPIAQPLATAKVSIFAVSTFDTDYVLVKNENLEKAIEVLKTSGHTVHSSKQEAIFVQPELRSARLKLEPITEDHTGELLELFSDNALHTFVPYEPLTNEQQRERCARWAKRKSPDGKEIWLNWLARETVTGTPVGHFQAGVKDDGVASIGYVVARKFQKQGLATEGLQSIFNYLKSDFTVREVRAWSDTRNLASHRVAQKVGMVQVDFIKDADFFKGSTSDEFVFSKVFRKKEESAAPPSQEIPQSVTSVYQSDPNKLPDSLFQSGELRLLVSGNSCRLLDKRRTPCVVEMVDWDCGLFRLRISDFEDKGKHWDLPFEDVSRFQFAKDSKDLSECDLQRALTLLEKYREPLIVLAQSSARVETETLITEATKSVTSWLRRESTFDFFSVGLNLAEPQASFEICSDLNRYLESIELSEQERLTSETYVINPYSGEWIKGIQIVLAEMGVKSFSGTIPRTKDIFTGSGATSERRRYLIHRLAFVRAVFGLLGQSTVTVYRGMSSERGWNVNSNKFFSSWSFSKAIAEAFIDTAPNGVARHSYLLKRSFPIQKLFMTHVETQAMNSQYKEVEAVVLHDDEDRLLW